MKTLHFALIFILSLITLNGLTQRILPDHDSLPIVKPKSMQNIYEVNHPSIKKISLVEGEPKAVTEVPKHFWGNLSGGALTLLTGINTNSATDAMYFSMNELNTIAADYSWKIALLFPGEYVKSRERVKNDDGSSSVVTEKGIQLDWSKGAYGLIIEKGDTISRFELMTNLQADQESRDWINRIESENSKLLSKLKKYEGLEMRYNFKISGIMLGKAFSIIQSGNAFHSIIFFDNKPVAAYQSEPNFIILGKKNKVASYMLYSKDASDSEQMNYLRLSMLSHLMANAVSKDFYSK